MDKVDDASLGKGRYRLAGALGQGSSGQVLRALDLATGLEVALKRLRSPSPEEAFHLKREFRALADVRHDGLARVYDLVVDDEDCFFTMALVEGRDLSAFVDDLAASGSRVDIATRVLPELVTAVRAVHSLGIVHRDLKPANILVENDEGGRGRLVIVDFGLLAPLAPDLRDLAALAELAGSVEYMAPEQLWGGPVTEAADWYAVGSLLFRILAGREPFEGDAIEIATAKATGAVPTLPPDDARPAWLGDLVLALLARRPQDRPAGARIEAALVEHGLLEAATAGVESRRRSGGWQSGSAAMPAFFGRSQEIDALEGALAKALAGRVVLATVRGASGVGKSELLHRFAAGAEQLHGAVVLRGRCHASEAIPRKGLDQVVDDLSRFLQMEASACDALEPVAAAALLRLFPVLGRVEGLARHVHSGTGIDPQRLRRAGVAAFGSVVSAIAASRPLVLWIDDVQWADAESAELLEAALQARGLSHALFLLSCRSEARPASPMLDLLLATADTGMPTDSTGSVLANTAPGLPRAAAVAEARDRLDLELGPLDEEASRLLVAELLAASGGAPAGEVDIDAIVREGSGSPFFLGELVRSLAPSMATGGAAVVPKVEEVIARRHAALPALSRRLLELVSLAAAPLAEATSVRAAGGIAARHALGELERQCLVRTVDSHQGRLVQPWHDRIAEGVRARLDAASRTGLHASLADALEGETAPDLELLVLHCSGAGQMSRAARHAAPAADRAARTLAFDRAAELYAFAMQHADDSADRSAQGLGLAEALANAGRGEEAGAAFEDAARRIEADPGRAIEALELRRRGAEQLLRCGRIDEGIARIREVLAAFGERLPASTPEAVRSFAWQRLRLAVRGNVARTPRSPLGARSTTKLDTMWSTTVAVSMVDLGLAGAVQARHFLEALDAGQPERLALAFAHEAAWRSALGPRMRRGAIPALEEARRSIAGADAPYARAWTTMAEGIVRWQTGQFAAAFPLLEEALALYRGRCRGVFFEAALTGMYDFSALALAGRLGRLNARVHEEKMDAARRRDRFALHGCLMGQSVFAWLADDDPDSAIAQADAAIAEWPADRVLMQHYHHLLTTAQAELYRGRGAAALAIVERAWKGLAGGGYLWLEFPSLELLSLRGRAALAACAEAGSDRDRRSLLSLATRCVRGVEKSALSPAPGFAAALRAGIASARGETALADAELSMALRAWRAADMRMHAAAAACLLDREGMGGAGPRPADAGVTGPRGPAHAGETEGAFCESSWAAREGCRDAQRLAASLIPLPRA